MKHIAWVERMVFKQMSLDADHLCPKETGGVLMGYWASLDQVVITNMIGSGPNAAHNRYSFTPDDQWQAAEISRIYEESGRVVTYLGDWHSHPGGSPSLSIKDLITLFRVAVHKPARASKPLMGILYNNPQWELEVWNFTLSKIISGKPVATMNVAWFDGNGIQRVA